MKPFRDFILCQIIEEEIGGLVVSKDVEDSQQEGLVIESGPGRYEYGAFVPNDIAPGQKVMWSKFAEKDYLYEEDGKKFTYVRAAQILAVGDNK